MITALRRLIGGNKPAYGDGKSSALPARLYSLDLTRAIASLAVVLFHWEDLIHFHLPEGDRVDHSTLPFHRFLAPLFDSGGHAIEFFFLLSGFVFFWLYGEKIARGAVGAWKYGVLRFSRLYPLHVATLLIMGALQFFHARHTGNFFKAEYNDGFHALAHLTYVYPWVKSGEAFNFPAWTICVEVMLYIGFFVLMLFGARRVWHLVALVGLGIAAQTVGVSSIGSGLIGFFAGGLTLYTCIWLRRNPHTLRDKVLIFSAVILWAALYLLGCLKPGIYAIGGNAKLPLQLGLFPLTVIALVLAECRRGHLGKRFRWMGDITYSSYLIHYPMLVGLVLAAKLLGGDITQLALQPWFLLSFFAVLIPLSYAVYRLFEKPMQNLLRGLLLGRRKAELPERPPLSTPN